MARRLPSSGFWDRVPGSSRPFGPTDSKFGENREDFGRTATVSPFCLSGFVEKPVSWLGFWDEPKHSTLQGLDLRVSPMRAPQPYPTPSFHTHHRASEGFPHATGQWAKTHESRPDPEGAPGLARRQGGLSSGSGVNLDSSAWPPRSSSWPCAAGRNPRRLPRSKQVPPRGIPLMN